MNDREDYYTFNEYMKYNSLTPSEEDYIEMIYRLSLNEEKIKLKEISDSLNIKPPSVTKMIKKLESKNFLIYRKYDYIKLTNMGEIVGKRLYDRHNIIYSFLQTIGLKEYIHEETEKIEHTISIETLIRIKELLRFFKENEEVLIKFRNYQNK
ncbi:metal-dependent transcriptional regulator [Romboutsia sp. CE17]|uniref:metal-dependent transcriptional regulator n=1 Tax=Romboutsia sp. CE17 TaxID=2724150 RepID=UPI001FABD897|nr:iron dependent repressor, metal binding and dimerization domain protein [Romboutsia sp. CE17]